MRAAFIYTSLRLLILLMMFVVTAGYSPSTGEKGAPIDSVTRLSGHPAEQSSLKVLSPCGVPARSDRGR